MDLRTSWVDLTKHSGSYRGVKKQLRFIPLKFELGENVYWVYMPIMLLLLHTCTMCACWDEMYIYDIVHSPLYYRVCTTIPRCGCDTTLKPNP